ncbi:hypothetical protein M1L60_13875 [Actinoplanes sp. TRM 88003]|uniref:PASTA domain-containing protein n=1 Tax=Paractinoplanes aksuensis TaxID=2939490 RepID=A0ABT1DLJ7_9ACTN|nr:hypothetical protein [Actinoplanes aksuensis]MCO8271680.1 hypothetical protein [Actinoplanes aksuensis]
MARRRWLAVAVAGLVALGCARPGAGDGDAAPLPPSPSASVPTASTAGGDAGDQGPAGDGAPHNAENNGWKQRHELSPDEQATGDALAARIRPNLAALRKAGDFDPASARKALLDLGLRPDDVGVSEMRQPPGVVFEVRFPEAGCVIGDVRPERLLVEVTGAAAEFGCLEPVTH